MLFFGLDHHYCCQCGIHPGATQEREGVSHTQAVLCNGRVMVRRVVIMRREFVFVRAQCPAMGPPFTARLQ
jgi:hypothetical protein